MKIDEKKLQSIKELLAAGGDERIELKANGLNKYYLDPVQYRETFNRGTCTCSALTSTSLPDVVDLYDRLTAENYAGELERQRMELKELISYEGEDKFDIFYAPSGSDLCYYPILFSRLIYGEKEILNVLTCPEELGSGSTLAAGGRYYFQKSQFGETIKKGAPIDTEHQIFQTTFPARNENGEIVNHKDRLLKTIHEHPQYATIVNLVIGSKSGIEDNINIIPEVKEDVFWAVDICQFRVSKKLINKLLDLDCMVMITGSKFYQAPPFCGALLVPKTVSDRFRYFDHFMIKPFRSIFSKYDIPTGFDRIAEHLVDEQNHGLLLRWEAALAEMKVVVKAKTVKVMHVISEWNQHVRIDLEKHPEAFELMPDQELTNKSIISFRIKNKKGKFLNDDELREIYKEISLGEFKEQLHPFRRVIIGQPVSYGDRSFIRLALGAYNVRKLLENDMDFSYDTKLIGIILDIRNKLF